jgi:hypothetical protein
MIEELFVGWVSHDCFELSLPEKMSQSGLVEGLFVKPKPHANSDLKP